jgi:hypothetical protein
MKYKLKLIIIYSNIMRVNSLSKYFIRHKITILLMIQKFMT